MLPLVSRRVVRAFFLLFGVSVLIFLGTEILPGDVATAILGQQATPEALAAIRASLKLNDPVFTRYWTWLFGLLHGDLGNSLMNGRPIVEQFSFRLFNSFLLSALAASVAVPLAVGLGIAATINRSGALNRIIDIATLSTLSLPEFFIGYLLIYGVAVRLRWLPGLSSVTPEMSLGTRLHIIILPTITLVLVVLAHMIRMTRAAILNVMVNPFIEMAFLKGLPRWRVVVEHALPNAAAPIINVIAFNLAYLIVGVVVVETVFVYPGIGQFMVDAVSKRDVPSIQACGLVFGATYVGLNLGADLLAVLANPRLRSAS